MKEKQSLGCSKDHKELKGSISRIEEGLGEFREEVKGSLKSHGEKIDGVKTDLGKVKVDLAGFKGKVLGIAGVVAFIITSILVPLITRYFNNH
ncbi:MAG: hypothetical protein V3U97_05465 [bacterium]